MSVSAGTGSANLDIDLVANGGPGFMDRLAKLAAAKKEHDQALKDLDLGRSAVQANDEAYRRLAEAEEIYAKKTIEADKDIAKVREEVNAWAEKTKADYTARLYAAQQAVDEAKAKQEAADAANVSAQATLKRAQAEAESMVADAKAQADELISDADKQAAKILAAANKEKAKVDASAAEMAIIKSKYEEAAKALRNL
jgi:FtsZ-interacting cell division protein ZipA